MKFDKHIRFNSGRPAASRILASAFATFLLGACGALEPSGSVDGGTDGSGVPVSFEAFGKWDEPSSKAVTTGVETRFESGDAMGVSAYHIPDGGSMDNAAPNFMYNQKVTCTAPATSSTEAAWTYSPVKYWPHQGHLNFYAYFPYTASESGLVAFSPNDETGIPSLIYNNPDADIDLMAASATNLAWNPVGTSPVEFPFRHLLARVRFRFTIEGDDSYFPVIHVLRYDVPYSAGRFSSWDGTVSWTELQSPAEVYRLTKSADGREITEGGVLIEEFTAYLLPCSFPSSDGTSVGNFTISLNNIEYSYAPAELISVKAGNTYTVNFKIRASAGEKYFITSFSMWEQGDKSWNADLK